MKISKISLIIMVIAFPLSVGGVAIAQSSLNKDTPTQTNTEVQSEKTQTGLKQRLESRKQNLNRQFNAAEKNNVKAKCRVFQNVLKPANEKLNSFADKRTDKYANIVTKLEKINTKLQSKNIDTKQLQEQITSLKDKTQSYNADMTEMKQLLSDLEEVDCNLETDGFIATFLRAKDLRQNIVDKGLSIRTDLKTSIKPLLKQIRSDVTNNKSESKDKL